MSRTSFPNQLDSFLEHDNQQTISPDHVNKLQDAVVALEQKVLELSELVSQQATVDLERLTGGEAVFTLADARAHAETPHGVTLGSLLKGSNYGIGLSAEAMLDRMIEDAHLQRNLLVSARGLRTIKQPDNTYRAEWEDPLKLVWRSSLAANNHTVTSVAPSGCALAAGDVLYVAVPRDILNNTTVSMQKAPVGSVPFDADGNTTLVIGYFDGRDLVLRNATSQIYNDQVADDAGLSTTKLRHPLFVVEEYGTSIAGPLDTILNTMFTTLSGIDYTLGEGIMHVGGGTFLGPVTFLPGGVVLTKNSDDHGCMTFGLAAKIRETDTTLEVATSKRIDLNAAQGVWIGGQNLKAPGIYDVALADATPVAAGAEKRFDIVFGTGNAIPTFPAGITPMIALTDASAPGSPYWLLRVNNATNTGCSLTLQNVSGAPQAVSNLLRLTILS